MSDPTPADPDTHVIRVAREPRPDGGAVYHVTVDAGSPTARDGELSDPNYRDSIALDGCPRCRAEAPNRTDLSLALPDALRRHRACTDGHRATRQAWTLVRRGGR